MTRALHSLNEFETALNARYAAFSVQPTGLATSAMGRIRDSRTLNFELAEIAVSGVTSHRAPLPTAMQDRMHLLMCRQGGLRISYAQSHIELTPGDAVMLDSSQAYVIDVAGECSARTIEMMRSNFSDRNCPTDALCGRRYRRDDGMVRILTSIVDNLADDPGAFLGDEHELVQDMLTRLLINARQDGGQQTVEKQTGRHPEAQILDKMRRWISSYPEKSELSPDMLATQFGMSRRSLYRIFTQAGTTPAQWLWRAKLDHGHAMLVDPAYCRMSVGAVAYQCGFQEPSHFSRAFKKRFGASPRTLRQR